MKNEILSDKEIAKLIEKHEQPGYERNYIDSYGADEILREAEQMVINKIQERMHVLGHHYKGAGSTVEAWNDMVFWLRGEKHYCVGYDHNGIKQ